MNRFLGGLGLASLAHLGVASLLGALLPVRAPRAAPAPLSRSVAFGAPAVAPAPTFVELLVFPEVTPAKAKPSAFRTGKASAIRTAAPAHAGRDFAAVPGVPAEPSPAASPGALRMRGFGAPRLVMPDLSRIAEAGQPPPPPVEVSGELAPAGGGRMRSDQGTFVAEVGRDGQVTLRDRPNLRVGFALPSPKGLGKALAKWYEDPYAQTRDPERQPLPSGVVDDEEEQRKRPRTVPVLSGTFDITDWVMRMAGRDPYLAAKLRFLDRTRAERVEMARELKKELLRNVSVIVRDHVTRAWAQPDAPADKRQMLFELWDECVEAGEPEEIEAAAAARAAIIGFIRGHLPAGSALAYTAAELDELNRGRTSRQPFAPYAP